MLSYEVGGVGRVYSMISIGDPQADLYRSFPVLIRHTAIMKPSHPNSSAHHDGTTVASIITMEPKQETVQHEIAISNGDPELKLVAAPFEEKTAEEKKLVRKVDLYLMPTIWVLYCFSYMVSLEQNIIHDNGKRNSRISLQ